MPGRRRQAHNLAVHRIRDWSIFVLGIDDDAVHAVHELPKCKELDREALAGASRRYDDEIRVV